MHPAHPITIVGGGLAGLALGIGLRQQNVPVTVWEAGHYPRHRVCGEFISGKGRDTLVRLGLVDAFRRAGATSARTAAFFMGHWRSPVWVVAPPAVCLSRFKMDALLAEQFLRSGGELRENERWQEDSAREGIVHATGRRLQRVENGWRWFGLKVHARNVPLQADLEMHGLQDGYVGLCRLSGDETNICGLFRRRVGAHEPRVSWQQMLQGPAGSRLHERLAKAEFDETSICSVAGLALRPVRASDHAECLIGDALTMIPPVTGNGMSMAFEAAEIAIGPLAAYSRGELAWRQAQETIALACDRAFAQRLAWARWLQRFMFAPILRESFGTLALGSNWLWQFIFNRTR